MSLAGWALFGVTAAALAVLASRRPAPAPDRAPVRFSIELDSTAQISATDPSADHLAPMAGAS